MKESYLKYWTNKEVINPKIDNFKNFEIRCYFDNDSDELINHFGKDGLVDLNVYRELVRSVKKMGYNAIDIHDQLGRAEFYLWDSYKKYWNYKGDIEHISKLIDIVHEEGLLVQIPMFLAWGFNHIDEKFDCWMEYSQEWKNTWSEYMESAIGKADIFILRPRSPIYDYPYQCKCEKCVEKGLGAIMTEAFGALEDIVLKYNPRAKLVCDLYFEGFNLWADGLLKVSNKWTLMVCDNGFGKLPNYEKMGQEGYEWGIYLHAGFWLNHTVQDPHLEELYYSVKLANEKNINKYIQVNGQSFKDFILNLEAISSLLQTDTSRPENNYFAWKDRFLTDWLHRVFNVTDDFTRRKIIDFIDKQADFHLAIAVGKSYIDSENDLDRGFSATMIHIVYNLIREVNKKVGCESSKKEYTLSSEYKVDGYLYRQVETMLIYSKKLYAKLLEIENYIDNEHKVLFNDRFTFPQSLFVYQFEFAKTMLDVLNDSLNNEEAKKSLTRLYNIAENGTALEGFKDWHKPSHARMHHPIPCIDIFEF